MINTSKNLLFLAVAIPALFLSGCKKSEESNAKLGEPKATSTSTLKEDVATTVVQSISLPKTVALTGSLTADEDSDVSAKRGGIVREVVIDRGSVVKKGDILVKLDTTDAANSLEQTEAAATELLVRLGLTSAEEKFDPLKQPDVKAAKALFDLAKSNFDRDQALVKSKVISPGEFEKTQNEYATTLQKYDLARAQANQLYRQFQTALSKVKIGRQLLQDMTVTAPFDGAVVEKLVSPGESVMDGARVARLVRMDPLRVVLNVPEQSVGKIDKGQKVEFSLDAFPGRRFMATVKNISPALDADNRTLQVEAMADNKDGLLKPGLFASAQLQLDAQRKGVRVPVSAVRRQGEGSLVFVVKEGVTQATMVVPGDTRKGYVEVINGLKGGETIVSDAKAVEDGLRIQ